MKTSSFAAALIFLIGAASSSAAIQVVFEHNPDASATASFSFQKVPPPSRGDAATKAQFAVLEGRRDRNGGDLEKLHDDGVPGEQDQPSENFFFDAGTDGGRLLVDLGSLIEIRQINSYSWHPGTRGPQVYQLYAADGTSDGFNSGPGKGTDPKTCGWKWIGAVDTRPKEGEGGGQYGVSISDPEGSIGRYRYLLFDISRTEDADPFGNTFYSEIDVIDRNAPAVGPVAASTSRPIVETVEAAGGKYRVTIDTSETPDLTEWAHEEVAPMVREWYPKIVEMLPSEGYEAPGTLSIVFSKDMRGVAATGGTRIRCAARWFRQNLKGEAVGAVFHEMVHVVQQYGRARRNNPEATRTPGWVVEGIADYLRWFKYEPQTHGAEITKRNISRARYDANYRITANFLNWVSEKYDKDIVGKLNAAAREGKYSEDLWKEYTGKTVQQLGTEWKAFHESRIADAGATDDGAKTELKK